MLLLKSNAATSNTQKLYNRLEEMKRRGTSFYHFGGYYFICTLEEEGNYRLDGIASSRFQGWLAGEVINRANVADLLTTQQSFRIFFNFSKVGIMAWQYSTINIRFYNTLITHYDMKFNFLCRKSNFQTSYSIHDDQIFSLFKPVCYRSQ